MYTIRSVFHIPLYANGNNFQAASISMNILLLSPNTRGSFSSFGHSSSSLKSSSGNVIYTNQDQNSSECPQNVEDPQKLIESSSPHVVEDSKQLR